MVGAHQAAVVIPTYNEAENILRLIAEIHAVVPEMFVLVIDDSSPDGTARLVGALSEKDSRVGLIVREGKQGLGTAYVRGFKECLEMGFQVVCQMDADFSHQPRYLADFLREIEQADVVLGSRYIEGGATEDWGIKRKLLSRGGNLYARTILGLPVRDVTGGYKCFRRTVLEAIDLNTIRSEGYAFQMELTYRAWRLGFRIREIPIVFPDRSRGVSKLSGGVFFEALRMPWILRFSKKP